MTTRASPSRSYARQHGAWGTVLVVALILPTSSCHDDGGVITGTLDVQAQRADDFSRAPGLPADTCTPFPILTGARREVTFPIDADLELEVSLTPDDVTVQFFGATRLERTYEREELVEGVRLRVASTAADYFVSLTEGCDG
jgi:hypothetical protein